MPELPEVETVRKGLEMAISGARIRNVKLRRKDLRTPFPKGFTEALAGRRITRLGRRAKYLLFYLDGGEVLIAHLGMSGRFSVLPQYPKSFKKHDHVVIGLEDGRALVFNDARRFGMMSLSSKEKLESHPYFKELGPEPLEKAFSADYLKTALAKRKGPIKPVLMDQKLVVGVGNIYASEALFLAGIDPRKPAAKAALKSEAIIDSIQKVLKDAIKSGGSSLRDFVQVSGETGYFQHHFNVYGKKGKACPVCHSPIALLRQAGRSSFFCKQCQK